MKEFVTLKMSLGTNSALHHRDKIHCNIQYIKLLLIFLNFSLLYFNKVNNQHNYEKKIIFLYIIVKFYIIIIQD